MTPKELLAQVNRALDDLTRADLVMDANAMVVQDLGKGRSRITWGATDGAILFEAPTLEEYLRLLRDRHFTALLIDGGLLQISYEVCGGKIVGHRLCYFPCPVLFDRETVAEFGLLEYIESIPSESLRETIRLEAPIRFDFDPVAAGPGHASSHLTFSRDCCRIPVFSPLSLRHFFQFVFANFYAAWWVQHAFLREFPHWLSDRTLTDEDSNMLHVECRRR
jgi:hypothetical protein